MRVEEAADRPWERVGRGLLWGLLILVLTAVIAAGLWSSLRQGFRRPTGATGRVSHPPVYGTVPEFSLEERSGRPFQLSDLRGNIWIASFIFTNCTEACPLITAKMAALQTDLRGVSLVRLVSITLDPERDTVAVLTRYAEQFGADPRRWLFLTGEKPSIDRLVQEGFHLSVSGLPRQSAQLPHAPLDPALAHADHGEPDDLMHSTRLVLVDGRARIRGYYDASDDEALLRLRQHVQPLLREE